MELKKIDVSSTPLEAVKPVTNQSLVTTEPFMNKFRIVILIAIAVLGLGTGYFVKSSSDLSSKLAVGGVSSSPMPTGGLKEGDIVGVSDDKTFKDIVKGVLDKGGMNGEGSHKLLRPGGKSQTVYLTSSVIDLDEFVGHEVTIWGQTFSGQKVGWLMDVGRVKIEKLNAPLPE